MAHPVTTASLDEFARGVREPLERALVARFGVHDGMDAAGHALAYLCADWDRVSGMANPAGYLYRVGHSYAVRMSRRRWRSELLVAEPHTTESHVDIDLQRALQRLRPEHRVAIVLVHAHGHTYAEAAQLMDVPTTTLTNHLTRGLNRLRRLMET